MSDQINNINEFKVFGTTIENFSVFYGSFLIFWGVVVSFASGSSSFTSFIPSLIGLPILIFSNLSIKFTNKKKNFYAHCCSLWINRIFRWFRFF